jgi:hypothetical protein
MIGISEYSTAYLTATGSQLIENSCYYLMGMSIPVSRVNNPAASLFKIHQSDENIYVEGNEPISQLEIFSLTGTVISKSKTNNISTDNLLSGVYVLSIKGVSSTSNVKFLKK